VLPKIARPCKDHILSLTSKKQTHERASVSAERLIFLWNEVWILAAVLHDSSSEKKIFGADSTVCRTAGSGTTFINPSPDANQNAFLVEIQARRKATTQSEQKAQPNILLHIILFDLSSILHR
jgi:hypothetical protein